MSSLHKVFKNLGECCLLILKKIQVFVLGGMLFSFVPASAALSARPGDSIKQDSPPVERISRKIAEQVALYHGERRFEGELHVHSSILLFWPWGDPAAFAVTLYRGKEPPAGDLMLDATLNYGAALVRETGNPEGYALASQPDRYITVYTGASTDMPPFIQAYSGLPDFLIQQAARTDLPPDPVWFFASPFHILGAPRPPVEVNRLAPALLAGLEAVDVHDGRTLVLGEIERKKTVCLLEEDRVAEWSRFLPPQRGLSYSLQNPPDAAVEEKRLPVQEWNTSIEWMGCYPASMYNLLMYNKFKHGVRLPPETPPDLIMLWISLCCRAFPEGFNWMTNPEWFVKGAGLIYRGLDHRAVIKKFSRKKLKREALFNKFVREIRGGWPPEIGGADSGVLRKHSCAGVGYRKINGRNSDLIVHDNYASTTRPRYITKYLLEGDHLSIHSIRAKKRKIYADSVPVIKAPKIMVLNIGKKQWKGKARVKSKNQIKSFVWGLGWDYYNHKGKKLESLCTDFTRLHPIVLPSGEGYRDDVEFTLPFPKFKRGRMEALLELIDQNGNPLEEIVTIRLEHVLGQWTFNFNWTGHGGGSVKLYLYNNGVFKTSEDFTGRWSLSKRAFKLDYDGSDTLYVGTVKTDFQTMSGTMTATANGKKYKGNWNTIRRDSIIYAPPTKAASGDANEEKRRGSSRNPGNRIGGDG